MANEFEAYVTKYALQSGIEKCLVKAIAGGKGRVRIVGENYPGVICTHSQWRLSIEEAKAVALQMKMKKLISLNAEIARIRAIVI